MKIIVAALGILLLILQFDLWVGEGSIASAWQLSQQIKVQQEQNTRLKARNDALAADVIDLKQGYAAIEERARSELGMIKRGETFIQVVE